MNNEYGNPELFLLRGLVGHHEDTYIHNATFHSQINLLVDMLHLWVDALALQAIEADKIMQQTIDQLKNVTLTDIAAELRGAVSEDR